MIARSEHWDLILNHNKNLLGKVMLVLRRHAQSVTDLTPEEWPELHTEVRRVTCAIAECFRPDHFNFAFLQNQDRHVQLHVIPRYASARSFGGQRLEDPDYPDHYAVPSRV